MYTNYKGFIIDIRIENGETLFQCDSYNIGVYKDLNEIIKLLDKFNKVERVAF
jgi:hypothetical protein